MATVRPMADADIGSAVEVWVRAFDEMRQRFGLPVPAPSAADLARQQSRMQHLLTTDPAGSWVAEDQGKVVGLSQSFVRDEYWVLALLGVAPSTQHAGTGRRLLEAALSHGEGLPGTIQCSRDPAAMRLYQSAGFALHPSVWASGPVRPGSVVADPRVRVGAPDDLELAASVDIAVRKSTRRLDHAHLLRQDDHRLLVLDDLAYAVVTGHGVVTLGAAEPAAAATVLATAMAASEPDQAFEVGWITAPQQWAIDTVLRAGLELRPSGPVMVRGMPAPPAPYLPSGGLG
jgi:ribosomal protein S18 acetylase RimI-like enzyme